MFSGDHFLNFHLQVVGVHERVNRKLFLKIRQERQLIKWVKHVPKGSMMHKIHSKIWKSLMKRYIYKQTVINVRTDKIRSATVQNNQNFTFHH